MKFTKKRVIVSSIVAFLVLGTGLCIVKASGNRGFCGRGFPPPFFMKAFPERILDRMDNKMEALNLSEEQKEKYGQLKTSFKADFDEMRTGRSQFMGDMRVVMVQENPDMQKLADLIKDRLNRMPEKMGTHLDQIVDFYNILNEEQKAKVLKRMRERMASCEKTVFDK